MKIQNTSSIQANLAVRYVDATDFGAHAVEWVILIREEGHLVLTVEGLPVARVEPIPLRTSDQDPDTLEHAS